MKLIKEPFLLIFPFSVEHQYSTAEKLISCSEQEKKKLPQRVKIANPRQVVL